MFLNQNKHCYLSFYLAIHLSIYIYGVTNCPLKDQETPLNKKSELMGKCRHREKYLLSTIMKLPNQKLTTAKRPRIMSRVLICNCSFRCLIV